MLPVPETHWRTAMVELVDAARLKTLMESGEPMVIVDARAEEDYERDHLPGAVSLLNREVEEKAQGLLARGVKIVVYSNDAACPASGLVAGKLDAMGFGPVFDYNDSYKDWVSRGYPLETRSSV